MAELLDALLAHRNPAGGGGPGQNAAQPRKPERTWRQCQLPKQQLENERNEMEDEESGVLDDDYECPMCGVAFCEDDENIAEHLKGIYHLNHKMRNYPKNARYAAMAKRWNETIYDMDFRVGGRLKIKKITRADVRHHMSKHYKPSEIERLDDMQFWLYDNMISLQDDGIYQRLYIDGEEQNRIEICKESLSSWTKLNNHYVKLGKLKTAALNQQEKSKNPQSMNTNAFIMAKIRKENQL